MERTTAELLHEFYAAATAYSRSKVWERCHIKLGVLIPGSPWRLGVPLGWPGTIPHGGFAIDEYTSAASPEPIALGAMPSFLMMTENSTPFADVEAAETHGFAVADGLYAVPLFSGKQTMKPSLDRPSASDLKWMTAALPAVAAFIDRHGLTNKRCDSW